MRNVAVIGQDGHQDTVVSRICGAGSFKPGTRDSREWWIVRVVRIKTMS